MIKQIAELFDIDINELLDMKTSNKKNKWIIPAIIIGIIVLLGIIVTTVVIINFHDDTFEMKTISTTCNNFNLTGSIAYNHEKTSIYISEINYCGLNEDKVYKTIDCALYQNKDGKEIVVVKLEQRKNTSLSDYLKELKFNVDNYATTCKSYPENSLFIKLVLSSSNEETLTYTIPLSLKENCSN